MNGFKAVLFDLDGTLIYSKGVIGKCVNDTLEHFGLEPFDKKELHGLIGVPLGKLFAIKTQDWRGLVDLYRELYLSSYLNGTWVYDGMVPILSLLRSEGKKIGIVTLKHTSIAKEVLKGLDLQNYVDAVVGDDDISELKPSPSHITRTCNVLKVEPEQTVVVGDTTMDITAGKKAKCKTIGVLWGAQSMDVLAEAGADYLARSPEELEELLKRL